MKARLRHNLAALPLEQRRRVVEALARSAGFDWGGEALKAVDGNGHDEDDFRGRYLRELWSRAEVAFSRLIDELLEVTAELVNAGQIRIPLDPTGPDHRVLSVALNRIVVRFLRQHGIPEEPGAELTDDALEGTLGRHAPWLVDLVEAGYRFGLLSKRVPLETPFEEAWPEARSIALTTQDRHVLAYLRQNAGYALRPVIGKVPMTIAQRLAFHRNIIRYRSTQAVHERIHPLRLAGFMADLTGRRIDRGDGERIWALGDWSRDWRRVARTEMARAQAFGELEQQIRTHPSNHGKAADEVQVPRVLAFKIPQAVRRDDDGRLWAPCKHCFRIWYADDATPRLYPLDEIIDNGDNVGRRAAEWRAVVGPTHPNCVCGSPQVFSAASLHVFPGFAAQLGRFAGQGFDGVP